MSAGCFWKLGSLPNKENKMMESIRFPTMWSPPPANDAVFFNDISCCSGSIGVQYAFERSDAWCAGLSIESFTGRKGVCLVLPSFGHSELCSAVGSCLSVKCSL